MLKVAIVDAYSSGNLFAAELRARGYGVLHVQSTAVIPEGYKQSFRGQDFEQNLVFSEKDYTSLGHILGELSKEKVSCVLAGSEPGVALADILSERLALKTNGTALSLARRNKFEMIERVRAQGISAPVQSLQTTLGEALTWIAAHTCFPVVLKPVNSAGTDRVAICNDIDEVKSAFDAIYGKSNRLDQVNDSVLVQEFLVGTEYAVNTVSETGTHFTSSVWKYLKSAIGNNDVLFYDRDVLLSPQDEAFDVLDAYAKLVLHALGIQHGPAHIEVMITSRGPVLIELGARMSGATMPRLELATTGLGQLDLTLDAYLDPKTYRQKISGPRELKQHSQLVTIRNEMTGTIVARAGLEKIQKLSSYDSSRIKFKVGDYLPATCNVFTSPGFVILSHANTAIVNQDYSIIREIERNGVFSVIN